MEPHREELQKVPEPGAERKPKRFRIVKLEERIAPRQGGNGTHNTCGYVNTCFYCNLATWTCRCP